MSTAAAAPWRVPTRARAAWRALKVALLVLLRTWQNLGAAAPRRMQPGAELQSAPVLAEVRSSLWTDGRADEFALVCGKVQNLRVAVPAFDGLLLKPGETLSFWRQLGRPSARRGFVRGREVLAGCVVPTIAGGICQLSNALATAAHRAGLTLVERHGHTARIEQAGAAPELDATVAWNYVDLRIQAPFTVRLEVALTQDELVLRLRGHAPGAVPRPVLPLRAAATAEPTVARGCLSCDETRCFRHRTAPQQPGARHAVLVDAYHPELLAALAGEPAGTVDWFQPWLRPARRAAGWPAQAAPAWRRATWASWHRMWATRRLRGEGAALQRARQAGAALLAADYARHLQAHHVDVTVDQDLLVPLWRSGALAGRRYRVYAAQVPARELQRRLDEAARQHPGVGSLSDFRAPEEWLADEIKALAAAHERLSPHAAVVDTFAAMGLSCTRLDWAWPQPAAQRSRQRAAGAPLQLVFPASALARKGALEVAEVARRLQAQVLLLGTSPSDLGPWQGVDLQRVGYRSDWLARADVVLLPAWVEHNPRPLLQALAHGVPVVATRACGLGPRPGLTEIEPGDVAGALAAVRAALPPESPP